MRTILATALVALLLIAAGCERAGEERVSPTNLIAYQSVQAYADVQNAIRSGSSREQRSVMARHLDDLEHIKKGESVMVLGDVTEPFVSVKYGGDVWVVETPKEWRDTR